MHPYQAIIDQSKKSIRSIATLLGEKRTAEVLEMIDHNEWLVALEFATDWLIEDESIISLEQFNLFKSACEMMTPDFTERLKKSLNYLHENLLEKDYFDQEQLHNAARNEDLDSLKQLLSQGFPINAFDELGNTALHYAAEKENIALIKFLISAGADVNAQDEETIGNSVLREVAQNCSYEVAKLLIEAGADPTLPGWMQLSALDQVRLRKKPEGLKVKELLEEAAKYPAKFRRFKNK